MVLGLGYNSFSAQDGDDSGALALEIHGDPFWQWGSADFSLAGGAEITGEGDFWIGAGVSVFVPISGQWFFEASVMPGYYDPGTIGNDLGYDLEFRSLGGIGYAFENGYKLSLAIDHKSNASLGDENPGVNTVSLRVRREF
ncbi:MAG: acyloxyacyl hydrolase [Pseudomonadota bacterium]